MAQLFDILAEWRKRFSNPNDASLPGGISSSINFPHDVAGILSDFLLTAVTV